MKAILGILVMALLVIAVIPMISAEGDDTDGGIVIDVGDPNDAPKVCTDSTQRSFYPNDQTFYTADEYGDSGVNDYGDAFYEVDERGNYLFAGETMTYYVIVEDENGDDDIASVVLQKGATGVGSCSEITFGTNSTDNFDCSGLVWDEDTMNFYRCKLVVQSGWNGTNEISIKATDESGASDTSTWKDSLIMNPGLSVTLTGSISFGTVEPGESVTSNSVYLNNVGSNGVVMDMYIASDDYFTDPSNPTAICGSGNGIPYDAFSYYATKGSLDSGDNDNNYPGLSDTIDPKCNAATDEYTELPSHSGEIGDMCRIINHREDASFLTQGQSMSLTFQLDVPSPCEGAFTDGAFHFVGRVV